MPPSARKQSRPPIIRSSSDDSDSDEERRPRKSNKNSVRPPIQQPDFDEGIDDDEESDFYDDNNRAYYNLANEVVNKNVKLQSLFDPKVLPGFYALINQTSKISSASRVLEASFKVYGKRVDVVHTEVKKLDHDVGVRAVEEKATKKKAVTDAQDPLNTSLSEWDAPQNGGDPGFFSEDDEVTITQKKKKQKDKENTNVDITTLVNFDFDDGNSTDVPSTSSNADCSFRFDDDNLGKKIAHISMDRTVLIGPKIRSAEEIENRLRRANAAANEHFRKETLRRGIQNRSKKESVDQSETRKDYSIFHVPFFQSTMTRKREKRHVCIDDVAATKLDYSRIFIHNEWLDDEDAVEVQDEGDFMDSFCQHYDNELDIIDGILEHFQGTLELATMANQKVEQEWVDMIGLEKNDLKLARATDLSFEQTANDDFDPEKRLVDRISIPGEDEIMDKEVARINGLVKQLFIGRVTLPGGPGNANENYIRRQFNKPAFCPMFHDEDVFFPFDLRKHTTEDSIVAQIAVARSFFINHFTVDEALTFGISEDLFNALHNFSLPTSSLPAEVLEIVGYLSNHFFIKCLLTEAKTSLCFVQESQYFSTAVTPFRLARFAQQLMNSVIHEVSTNHLRVVFVHGFSQSLMNQSTVFQSNSRPKRSKLDETFCSGDTDRYFAANEAIGKPRYHLQIFGKDGKSILELCTEAVREDRGSRAFLHERIEKYKIEAMYALLNNLKLFVEFKNKDLSSFPIVTDLPKICEISNGELDASPENTQIQHDLINLLDIPVTNENLMDVDYGFDYGDNDGNFAAALETPPPANDQINGAFSPVASFSDNDNDAIDDFNDHSLIDPPPPRSPSVGFNDSLQELVADYPIPEPVRKLTRKRKSRENIEFVYDDAHWEQPGDNFKKVRHRKSLNRDKENADDNLLFVPRDTFAKVNTSQRRNRSNSSAVSLAEPERIPRCQDVSYPAKIREQFAYRLDDQLALCIPGHTDPDKIFIAIPFPDIVKKHLSTYAVLYRGEHCRLPPTVPVRQDSDFQFWLNVHRMCENIRQERKSESRSKLNDISRNDFGGHAPDYSDDDCVDADNGFDPHTPPHPIHPLSEVERINWLDVVGEYNYRDSDGEDDDEIDDFDFVSKVDKSSAIEYGEGTFYLKRAIKFILTRQEYEKPNIAAILEGKGHLDISNELAKSQYVAASTPIHRMKDSGFYFDDDEEIVSGEDLIASDALSNKNHATVMEVDDGEDDDEGDTDEKHVKNFQVNGFHTLKSILYYLPEVCHHDTIRILSTAHVFCTLCHMANENSLCLKQEESEDGDVDEISDCQIVNIEEMADADMELATNE